MVTGHNAWFSQALFLKLSVKRDAALQFDVTACVRVQPELACARRRAVAQQSASETQPYAQFMLLYFGTWISGTDVSTTLSFFPVQTKIMNVPSPVEELERTYLNPHCVRKMDRGKLSWAAPVRESNLIRPENWNHFRCGAKQNTRVHGGTSSNLMSPLSTEAPVESCWPNDIDAGAWASVANRRSCSCACLSISPSVCVCVCVCVALWVLSSYQTVLK